MSSQDNASIETFKSIPEEEFLEKFDLPKVPYCNDTIIPIRYAGLFMEEIAKEGSSPERQYFYDEAFTPFVYLLYQAEVGYKNRMKFDNEGGHIFAPQSTEAYNFLVGKKVFVNPPEYRIEEIQALRNTFLRLISERSRREAGFGRLSVKDSSDEDIGQVLEFLIKLFGKGRNIEVDWDHAPAIEVIYDNVFY